jgi:hypothetical protein
MDVDLMSDEAVREFVSSFGFVLFGDYDERSTNSDIWSFARAFDYWPERFSEQLIWAMEGKFSGDRWHDWRFGIEERFGSEGPPADIVLLYELAIESRVGLAALRDLSRLVQYWLRDRLGSLPKTWELGLFEVDPPKDSREAFDFMVGAINGALSGISARLVTQPDHRVGATVYVASVAQMFNHIAQNADYKICANETCSRPFVHQVDGTSEYGQYRSEGVIYCSNRCARAQVQREYRRRKEKKKRVNGTGA